MAADGAGLLTSSPEFRASIEACDRAFAEHVDWSLLAVLAGLRTAHRRWSASDVVQPALFAVMVSLAQLWRSLGVRPDMRLSGTVRGRSRRRIWRGGLSLADAARVVALRARALVQAVGQGAMAAVELSRPRRANACAICRHGSRLRPSMVRHRRWYR